MMMKNRCKQNRKTGNDTAASAENKSDESVSAFCWALGHRGAINVVPNGESIWGCSQHTVSYFTNLASTHKHLQARSKKKQKTGERKARNADNGKDLETENGIGIESDLDMTMTMSIESDMNREMNRNDRKKV